MSHNRLPDDIISPQDLKSLILEVRRYAQWYSQYAVKSRLGKSTGHQPPEPTSQVASDLLADWAKTAANQQGLDQLIGGLEDLFEASPRLTITLAAPAPGSLKKTMVEWCRQNIAPDVLVTFKFNSTILGGIVMQYGSHVYDWSFRRQILANASKFPEVLRHV